MKTFFNDNSIIKNMQYILEIESLIIVLESGEIL